jgi:hypothetical protein
MKRAIIGLIVAMMVVTISGTAYAQADPDTNGDGIFCYKFTGGGRAVIKDNRPATSTGCPAGFDPFDTNGPLQERIPCATIKSCNALRELCIAASGTGWVYQDLYDGDNWIGGECFKEPPIPQ